MGFLLILILLINLSVLISFSSIQVDAQRDDATRILDHVLGDYAFRSYSKRYKTGFLYTVSLPSKFSDIQADIVRFRCGSLRRYGANIKEFRLSTGINVQPCVRRVVLIRQNLGKTWSSIYYQNYNISGYQLVSPVLGLLAYDARRPRTRFNSSLDLAQLEIFAEKMPVKIDFSNVTKIKTSPGVKPLCASFGVDGKVVIYDTVSSNLCVTARHGHFGLVIESPRRVMDSVPGRLSEWKIIIGSSVGGALGVFLLGLLFVAMVVKVKKRSKIAELERKAYEEEALQISMVGHVRVPVAGGTRTGPSLEHEYSPP